MKSRNFSFSEQINIILSEPIVRFGVKVWTVVALIFAMFLYVQNSNTYVTSTKVVPTGFIHEDGQKYIVHYQVDGQNYETDFNSKDTLTQIQVHYLTLAPSLMARAELVPTPFEPFILLIFLMFTPFIIVYIFLFFFTIIFLFGLSASFKRLKVAESGELAIGKYVCSELTNEDMNKIIAVLPSFAGDFLKTKMKEQEHQQEQQEQQPVTSKNVERLLYSTKDGKEQSIMLDAKVAKARKRTDPELLLYLPKSPLTHFYLDTFPAFLQEKFASDVRKLNK